MISAAVLPERLSKKVVTVGECLVWTGCVTSNGYGQVWFDGKPRRPHRVAYELTNGPIAEGMTIDHLCRNKLCINPRHLEQVTNAVNVRRWADTITHCPRGHEYSAANTYVDRKGCRNCRACRRAKRKVL